MMHRPQSLQQVHKLWQCRDCGKVQKIGKPVCRLLLQLRMGKPLCRLLLQLRISKPLCRLLPQLCMDKPVCRLLLRLCMDKPVCRSLLPVRMDKPRCECLRQVCKMWQGRLCSNLPEEWVRKLLWRRTLVEKVQECEQAGSVQGAPTVGNGLRSYRKVVRGP